MSHIGRKLRILSKIMKIMHWHDTWHMTSLNVSLDFLWEKKVSILQSSQVSKLLYVDCTIQLPAQVTRCLLYNKLINYLNSFVRFGSLGRNLRIYFPFNEFHFSFSNEMTNNGFNLLLLPVLWCSINHPLMLEFNIWFIFFCLFKWIYHGRFWLEFDFNSFNRSLRKAEKQNKIHIFVNIN